MLDSSSEESEEDEESSEWEDAMSIMQVEEGKPSVPETVDLVKEVSFTHEITSFNTDIPDKIKGARGWNGEVYYCVEFKKRRDGYVPHVKIISHPEMSSKLPHLLIDYLLQNAS